MTDAVIASKNFIIKYKSSIVLILIAIFLFLVPQIFWKQDGYFVGGDDSLLHYMYPTEMIENFAKNIAINNTLSGPAEYVQRLELLPLLYLISLVNFVTGAHDSLYIFLGFILSASFLSFYFLCKQIDSKAVSSLSLETYLVSLLYTFSVHHYLSVMNYKLVVMYIVFLVPFALALFTKAIIKKQPVFLIPIAVVTSIFSVVLAGTPWLAAYIISVGGLLLYLFVLYPKRFIGYSLILIALLLLLNIYWLFHFAFAIISGSSATSVYSGILTDDFRRATIDAILSVTNSNSLYDAMLTYFHPNLQRNFQWPTYPIHRDWYARFELLYALIIFFITSCSIYYKKAKNPQLFPYVLLGWLVTLYFFTVNMFGVYGIRVFLWLNKIIPGFSMFRNNYDKFASGMAFSIALLLFAITLQMHANKQIPKIIRNTWLIVLFAITLVTITPVIGGKFERDLLLSTKQTATRITNFDSSFVSFAQKVSSLHLGSILWLPLSNASYVVIPDDTTPDRAYAGISPLLFLGNTHDYAGLLSFRKRESSTLSNALATQDSVAFGNLLKELGITHLAVNATLSDDIQKSYLYGANSLANQNQKFLSEIVGDLVFSVDDSYYLYKVSDEYFQEQLYAEGNCFVSEFKKIDREKFSVAIERIDASSSNKCELFFKQPYHEMWILEDEETGYQVASQPTNRQQNTWTIDSDSRKLTLFFRPRSFTIVLFLISGVTLLAISIVFIARIRST